MERNLALIDNIGFSQEELESIEHLAGLNYTPLQMATFLDQDPVRFLRAMSVSNSIIQFHINKGKLESDFLVNEKVLQNAKTGNLTAVMIFNQAREKNDVESIKRRILYGED
ncbi:hypothetical protein ACI6PS_02530 [Flavobacterium sp. PLA-1-15]|uniref:hypothetical protein n=1 Tax=Flavobacterium sp. PLA-1-15 TaxID=3380533 RepID=UPI003B817320